MSSKARRFLSRQHSQKLKIPEEVKHNDLSSTQVIDVSGEQSQPEEPLLSSSASSTEDLNSYQEELFEEKLTTWFADYAPKLFDLAAQKYLSKQNKRKREESSVTSLHPVKKRRVL